MDAYDIGVGDRKIMKGGLLSTKLTFPMEFTQQIPVRVLLRCLEVFGSIKMSKRDDDYKHESRKDRNETEVFSDRLEDKFLSQSLSKEEVCKGSISEDKKLQAKNDDATAQVAHWNARVCDRLGIIYKSKCHDSALD